MSKPEPLSEEEIEEMKSVTLTQWPELIYRLLAAIDSLREENFKLLENAENSGFWGRAAARLTKENKKLKAELEVVKKENEQLKELIAVTNCDGGHYCEANGVEKAVQLGMENWHDKCREIDKLKTELEDSQKEVHKLEDENDKLTGTIGKPFSEMDRQQPKEG